MTTALEQHLDRSRGVILARLRGPRARRGTKWWTPGSGSVALETKAIDANYVAPDRITADLREEITPVAMRIALSSAQEASGQLGMDLGGVDTDTIRAAVDDAVARILGVADRHVREVRSAILAADDDAESLDDVLGRVEAAHRRGGNWVLMSGRTLGSALANAAALAEARRAGVTHAQWVSRRDERVRVTHRRADGQVRPVGASFRVGAHQLDYPGDPSSLPASWEEVAGCRCGLAFFRPDPDRMGAIEAAEQGRNSSEQLVRELRQIAEESTTLVPTPDGSAVPMVTTPATTVGYRSVEFAELPAPGQVIRLSAEQSSVSLVLLATAATLLTVVIPAGVAVGVSGDVLTLPPGVALSVASATSSEVIAEVEEE